MQNTVVQYTYVCACMYIATYVCVQHSYVATLLHNTFR